MAGDVPCSTSTERLLDTRGRHRLVEQRAGLLTLAGTVEPGIFACATRPRRLVKRGADTAPPSELFWSLTTAAAVVVHERHRAGRKRNSGEQDG